jgi:hypothetical protein
MSDYYSKRNPHGPWGDTKRPNVDKPSQHIEGFSTPKNIQEWAAYASRNSGPKVAPGLGRKTAPAIIRKPFIGPDE